ncbi:MAG: DUF4190 domain-containing protein [Lachnospiraceae bacterium]|nr:DUF4190 domain-containing protein [Lachnospiraceae bacterium]
MGKEFETDSNPGLSVLGLIGFFAAFLLAPVGFVLSIIAIAKKDGKSKGFAIAGLVISIINIIAALLVSIIVIAMAPQVIKYVQKSNYAQDVAFADCIHTALETAAYDPYVAINGMVPYSDVYVDINSIPYGAYRDSVEQVLGVPLEDLPYQFKSHDVNDIVIEYILTDKKCSVKISDLDPNDGNTFSIVIN